LLADRASTLPLAEVLNGSAPRAAEARANAFSAEFLIPREFAADVMSKFGSDQADYVAKRLADRFNVSKEIVAWQVRNTISLEPETQARLRALVSRPEEF
jgi:Zn-dependent peptidase ImmA (M78 family)